MFVFAIISFIVAIIALAGALLVGTKTRTITKPNRDRYSSVEITTTQKGNRLWFFLVSGSFAFLGILFTIFASTFTVDTGSSVVLKDWSGVVQSDPIVTPGFHTKAPWQDDIAWDVKNQNVMFTGDGTTTHDGQKVAGAELEFNDKDGVKGWLDIQVVYSISPDKTVDLTQNYSDQTNFAITVVENDVKSLPRDVVAKYTTIETFNERDQLRTEIAEKLKDAWEDKGILLENVNIQGIRRPDDVNQRFNDAQNAATDLLKAETDAKTAETIAQGQANAAIAAANGEAEANRLIAASLTPEVLQQRYIDALSAANTIVVPNDFTSLGQLPQPAQ